LNASSGDTCCFGLLRQGRTRTAATRRLRISVHSTGRSPPHLHPRGDAQHPRLSEPTLHLHLSGRLRRDRNKETSLSTYPFGFPLDSSSVLAAVLAAGIAADYYDEVFPSQKRDVLRGAITQWSPSSPRHRTGSTVLPLSLCVMRLAVPPTAKPVSPTCPSDEEVHAGKGSFQGLIRSSPSECGARTEKRQDLRSGAAGRGRTGGCISLHDQKASYPLPDYETEQILIVCKDEVARIFATHRGVCG
jgi:hypothetical protein